MRRRKTTQYYLPNGECSIAAAELRRSDRETKMGVMRAWFYENYENPAENTPYESAEGGYIYIWGGPYDPEWELEGEFSSLVSGKLIKELAAELRDISLEWTGRPKHEEVDEYLFGAIAQGTEHHQVFVNSITNVENLLALDVSGSERTHLLRLLYVNVITSVETYLSDLFISAVGSDRALLRLFVETTPEFKTEKVPVSEIFKTVEVIEKRAHSYLMDVVWHRLDRVKPMFHDTLGIQFPDNISLFKEVLVRHDLVHRNGRRKDGGEHNISLKTVKDLIKKGRAFVASVDKGWRAHLKRRKSSPLTEE